MSRRVGDRLTRSSTSRRDKVVRLYFTQAEFDRLSERARSKAQSVPRFVRDAALGVVLPADPLLRELALVGRSLEQVTRQAAASPAVLAEALAALDRHRSLVERVLQEGRDSAETP